MIRDRTVLVLGAGASKPYGFPTGGELLREVYDELGDENSGLARALVDHGFVSNQNVLQRFRQELNRSGAPSIDAYLERMPSGVEERGKAIIAARLIRCEYEEMIYRDLKNPRWYEILLERMDSPLESFHENQLTVVTFNYDRSMEYFFFHALKSKYAINQDKAVELVDGLKIIHVHGQLGKPQFLDPKEGRPYSPGTTPEAIEKGREGIRIIHEASEDTDEFSKAREAIAEAQMLCFLGFGYHEANLRRLGVNREVVDSIVNGGQVLGTAYELTGSKIEEIREIFGYVPGSDYNFELGGPKETILEFLKRKGVFK